MEEDIQNTWHQSPQMPKTPFKAPRANTKRILYTLLAIVVIGGAIYGAWWWQGRTINAQKNQISELEQAKKNLESELQTSQAHTAAAQATLAKGFATGQADADGLNVIINVMVDTKQISLKEIWVEFGKDPENLDMETAHVSDELGIRTDEYGAFTVQVPDADIESGTYFYRAAGMTTDGKTVYGGIATFQAPK